jgi:hypothetical protein
MSVRLTKEEAAALHRLATSRDFYPMDGGEAAASAVEKVAPTPEPEAVEEPAKPSGPPRGTRSTAPKGDWPE